MTSLESAKSYTFVQNIINAGGQPYWVGGCVRDLFLKRDVKDLDLIVCNVPFKSLIQILNKSGRVNLVGKSFGVIKFHPHEAPDSEIDIALPRTEKSIGAGHRDFEVDFDETLPIETDLKRRDFTINAMAMDVMTGRLVDPYHGEAHLKQKLIQTVFENSFVEDPLRLMRAIQFAARFEFKLEHKTFGELQRNAHLIRKITPERVILEVAKLFSASKPSVGFDLMRDTGLLPFIFPDVQNCIGVTQPNKNNEDVYTHTMKVLDASRIATELHKPGDLTIMFAALFHDMGKPKTRRETETGQVSFFNHQHISAGIARRWMRDFRISTIGVDPRAVCHLVKNHMFETTHFKDNPKALRRFINKVGTDHINDLIDLRLADKKGGRFPSKVYGIVKLREQIHEEINRKTPFSTKDLALNGSDIMGLGFTPGPVIGIIQRFLMEKVLDDPELNTKDILSELVEANRADFLARSTQPQAVAPLSDEEE